MKKRLIITLILQFFLITNINISDIFANQSTLAVRSVFLEEDRPVVGSPLSLRLASSGSKSYSSVDFKRSESVCGKQEEITPLIAPLEKQKTQIRYWITITILILLFIAKFAVYSISPGLTLVAERVLSFIAGVLGLIFITWPFHLKHFVRKLPAKLIQSNIKNEVVRRFIYEKKDEYAESFERKDLRVDTSIKILKIGILIINLVLILSGVFPVFIVYDGIIGFSFIGIGLIVMGVVISKVSLLKIYAKKLPEFVKQQLIEIEKDINNSSLTDEIKQKEINQIKNEVTRLKIVTGFKLFCLKAGRFLLISSAVIVMLIPVAGSIEWFFIGSMNFLVFSIVLLFPGAIITWLSYMSFIDLDKSLREEVIYEIHSDKEFQAYQDSVGSDSSPEQLLGDQDATELDSAVTFKYSLAERNLATKGEIQKIGDINLFSDDIFSKSKVDPYLEVDFPIILFNIKQELNFIEDIFNKPEILELLDLNKEDIQDYLSKIELCAGTNQRYLALTYKKERRGMRIVLDDSVLSSNIVFRCELLKELLQVIYIGKGITSQSKEDQEVMVHLLSFLLLQEMDFTEIKGAYERIRIFFDYKIYNIDEQEVTYLDFLEKVIPLVAFLKKGQIKVTEISTFFDLSFVLEELDDIGSKEIYDFAKVFATAA
jgi:hypothetical protein